MESQPFNLESGHDLEVENAAWSLNRSRTSPYGKKGKGKGNAHTQSGGTHPAGILLTSTLEDILGKGKHGQGKDCKGNHGAAAKGKHIVQPVGSALQTNEARGGLQFRVSERLYVMRSFVSFDEVKVFLDMKSDVVYWATFTSSQRTLKLPSLMVEDCLHYMDTFHDFDFWWLEQEMERRLSQISDPVEYVG
jgi:hypothetical protein